MNSDAPGKALERSSPSPDWPPPAAATSRLGGVPADQMLQTALSAGALAAWHSDLRTRIRWWSPEMFRIHGVEDGAGIPPDYLDLVHPQDRPLVERAFADLMQQGSHQVQYRVVWPDGSTHWLEGAGRAQVDGDGQAISISGVCALIDRRKQEEADLRFLAQATTELARSTDYEETLKRVAALAVPHFADWCAIDMLDASGELNRVAVSHVDPSKLDLARELHRRYPPEREAKMGIWNVLRSGAPELVAEITDELLQRSARDAEHLAITRSLGLRSYMGVPIVGPDRVLGAVTFVSSESRRVYGERDLHMAMELLARAAIAIQNADMFRALRDSDARQNFLLRLTDILRHGQSTLRTLHEVSEMLGRHFRVDRVGYGDVDESQDLIDFEVCWTDGTVPPLQGRFPASAFGPQVIRRLREGRTVAIADVRAHPLTSEQATIRTSHEVDTRAILVVPLFKAGRLRTIVYLNQRGERCWTQEDVALMEEVAERTRELIERRRTEDALRRSESRWRGLFERMSEGFFLAEGVRRADGRIGDFVFLEVNPSFEKLTGVAPSAAIGRPVSEVIPGFPDEVIALYGQVLDTGEPREFEVQVPALADRWYEARASRVADNQFSVMFVEVTDRKRAQADLQLAADRYRTLFESIDEGFCILEMIHDASGEAVDYRFLEVNPAFERHAGLPDPVGRTIRDILPGIDDHYIRTYARVAATGQPVRFESHERSMDRWFDAFAFRIGDPAQHRVALLFNDITDRKRTEAALRDREAELREAQSLAGIGSWTWDPAGDDHPHLSPELLRIFGLAEGQRLPEFARQRGTLYRPEDWDRLNERVQAALAEGRPYAIDLRAYRGDRPIWVTARGAPVVGRDGRVTGLRGTIQDITERKQIEEALREADLRKDEFLATLAHELRNPLAPLRNGLSILRLRGSPAPECVRARELMDRQLSVLVRLVDDLLDVSRVSQGKVVMKKTLTSLQAIVDLALETSRPLIEAAGHELRCAVPRDPLLLHVDATRIAQVLSNLLNNAAKYTPPGGCIRLAAQLDRPGRLRLSVQDNGVGIPAAMLERVFDLFTQVPATTGRSQGGLGIGLSLAKRLVELHGGRIHAESGGEHAGSTFIVELPVLDAPVEACAADDAHPHRPSRAGHRVLVVDDNADAAESLSLLLELQGHEVEVVHSGQDAVDAARRRVPDVVFLDIGLPDIDGYEVAARLKALPVLDGLLLVALTGWGGAAHRARAQAAGIDLHLTKPVLPEDLARALGRLRTST